MPPKRKSTAAQDAADMPPPQSASRNQPTTRSEAPKITPRNSLTEGETTTPVKDTPYNTLQQLASVLKKPATPLRSASAGPGPPSALRTARRTPGQNVTPTGGASARKPTASTPYGRAAIRDIEMRRAAALTPGKDRRRSGRQRRETPRDILRQLSKVLAPVSKPIESTPTVELPTPKPRNRLNDMDDDAPLPRPRLSMPLGDDEDDSLLLPPQSDALNEEDNLTVRSVEMPRRARSEQPGRLSRGSFGSIRNSTGFDTTLPEFGLDGDMTEGFDPSFVQGGFDDDEPMLDDPSMFSERTGTMDMRAFGDDRRSSAASRRDSYQRGRLDEDENDIMFQFQVPTRDPDVVAAQQARMERRRSSMGVEAAREGRSSLGVVPEEQDEDVSESENEPLDDRKEEPDEDIEEAEEDNELEEEEEDVEAEEDKEMVSEVENEDPTQRDISNLDFGGGDSTLMNSTMLSERGQGSVLKSAGRRGRPAGVKTAKKTKRVSKHGIEYPSLSAGVVKKLASSFARTGGNNGKLNKDTLAAIMQASEWYFEQVSEDLGAYAEHAGRKTIDESDVLLLMQR